MHECKHPLAPSIFWSSRKSSTQSFPLLALAITRASRDGSSQIFSNVPALIKQAVWEPARLAFRTPDVCGLQLIQRSDKGWSALPRALTHPPPSLVIVIILCPPQADYVRRRVMRDCGVALPYARLVDPVQSPWQYSGCAGSAQ
jgi:hypothetical protein